MTGLRNTFSNLGLLFSTAFLSIAMSPLSALAMTAEDIFRDASPAVWMVRTVDTLGRTVATGSAVVVGPERLITNCHVLAKGFKVTVRHEGLSGSEQGAQTLPAVLEYPDAERDLCQLRVATLTTAPVVIAPSGVLAVGQKVYAIGAPHGLELTLSDGLVSALRRDTNGAMNYIQTSAPVSPGSSGGGLFDDQGRLIGITTAMFMGSAQNLNFARPAQWISEVAERGRSALAARAVAKAGATSPAVEIFSSPSEPLRLGVPSLHSGQSIAEGGSSVSRQTGQDTYGAERYARTQLCTDQPRAFLIDKGPGFETYSVPCSRGEKLLVRCEFGNCRTLR
jgi:serine protease Do